MKAIADDAILTPRPSRYSAVAATVCLHGEYTQALGTTFVPGDASLSAPPELRQSPAMLGRRVGDYVNHARLGATA
jgi:hypothetical protein